MSRKRDRVRRRLETAASAAGAAGLSAGPLEDLVSEFRIAEDALASARSAELVVRGQVAFVRRQGYTWQEIGDALGISRQAAHARWAEADRAGTARRARRGT